MHIPSWDAHGCNAMHAGCRPHTSLISLCPHPIQQSPNAPSEQEGSGAAPTRGYQLKQLPAQQPPQLTKGTGPCRTLPSLTGMSN